MSVVVGVFGELQVASETVTLIRKLEDVNHEEVSIEGRVTQLWRPSGSVTSRVGLTEDDSEKTKFTSWAAGDQPRIERDEHVRIHRVAEN